MNDGKEHRYTADELREIVKERRARSRDEDERNAKMCAEEVIDNLNSKMRRAAENGDTSVESSINIISSVYRKQCPAKIFLEETCDILDRYFAARGFVLLRQLVVRRGPGPPYKFRRASRSLARSDTERRESGQPRTRRRDGSGLFPRRSRS